MDIESQITVIIALLNCAKNYCLMSPNIDNVRFFLSPLSHYIKDHYQFISDQILRIDEQIFVLRPGNDEDVISKNVWEKETMPYRL